MDIEALRIMTQSTNVKELKTQTVALTTTLAGLSAPVNQGARWGMFMLGLSAACVVEGWVAHDPDSEDRSPCRELVAVWCDFCQKARSQRWFSDDEALAEMMRKVLILEGQRLHEDGWVRESFEHSYLFRFQEYTFEDLELEGNIIFNLPVTPEA